MNVSRLCSQARRHVALRLVTLCVLMGAYGSRVDASPDFSTLGAATYAKHCAQCHGDQREGSAGPALKGTGFEQKWMRRVGALAAVIKQSMPLNSPGSLTAIEYRAVTEFVASPTGNSNAKAAEGMDSSSHRAPPRHVGLPAPPTQYGIPSATDFDDSDPLQSEDADWAHYNRDFQGTRYSPLVQINRANVATLTPKCLFQVGEIGSFQASPIVSHGTIFMTTAHRTFAIDGATCRERWSHTYTPVSVELLPTNRGVALYNGSVIRGTLDGHLIALDAGTGQLLWDVWVCDSREGCFLSAAPVVFDGKLFIGEAGGDFGGTGHIYAFDAASGNHLWTFDVIPTGSEAGADTWGPGSIRGGGSTWTTITVDPVAHLLYVPVGNPNSDFDGRDRPGANLYSNSIVVLDSESGHLRWYVQQIPHDVHDWDTAAAPVIFTQDGQDYMAVGSKDARLYLYRRDSRALIARKDLTRHLNDELPIPTAKGLHVCPGVFGGVEWNGPALDPADHLLFVNSVDWCTTLTMEKRPRSGPIYGGTPVMDPQSEARGVLSAFDSSTGAEIWSYQSSGPMLAGVTPTASGLVFTGSGTGDFLAFDAKTGKKLLEFYTGGMIAGGISPYAIGKNEYIAVATGNNSKTTFMNGGAATVIVFGLP